MKPTQRRHRTGQPSHSPCFSPVQAGIPGRRGETKRQPLGKAAPLGTGTLQENAGGPGGRAAERLAASTTVVIYYYRPGIADNDGIQLSQ